uniref:transposase n=1 Tax=Cellulosilyticum ruminicola TaxID=425254 RepID=UPI00155DA4FD
ENMTYDEKEDVYLCKAGRRLTVTGLKRSKSKTGYVSEKTQYTCEDCSHCEFKKQCIKGNNSKTPLEERTKRLEVSKVFRKTN